MNSAKSNLVSFLITLSFTSYAYSEVLRWPQACLSGELEVTNTTTKDNTAWIQKFESKLLSETEYVFKANSTTKLLISAEKSSNFFSLLHFEKETTFKVNFTCSNLIYSSHNFEGGILTFRKSNLAENKIWLQNLFTDVNAIQIELLNRKFQSLNSTTINLKSLEHSNYKIPATTFDWSYIRVSAHNRFTVFNLTTTGSVGPMIIDTQKTSPSENPAYFVVGPRDNSGDQFIVQIKDLALIEKAREQISNPVLEKIVFAKIQKGHSDFNRNWSKKEKSFWSWSTTEVTNISDIGSTMCNGFPQAVEDRMDEWVKEPGIICFWSYRIKKELTPAEVAEGASFN